jgi:hypothetical protein
MNGMTGWKGVVFLAGEGHTPQMSHNGSAIRALLVKQGLQEMRQYRGDKGGEKDVVGYASFMAVSVPGIDPPSGSERTDDMLIGAPGGNFSCPLRQAPRMIRDRIGDRYVCPRRAHSDRRHRVHCLPGGGYPTDSELATALSVPFDAICVPGQAFARNPRQMGVSAAIIFSRTKSAMPRGTHTTAQAGRGSWRRRRPPPSPRFHKPSASRHRIQAQCRLPETAARR